MGLSVTTQKPEAAISLWDLFRLNVQAVAAGVVMSAVAITGTLIDLGRISPGMGIWAILVPASFALPAVSARINFERRRTPWSKELVAPQIRFVAATAALCAVACAVTALVIFQLSSPARLSPQETLGLIGGGVLVAVIAGVVRSRQRW
jgi:hypothetical protein